MSKKTLDILGARSIKKMSIKDFSNLGYIGELNRRFLNPLGLALAVFATDDGKKGEIEVWDFRDDPEGVICGYSDSEYLTCHKKDKVRRKAEFIEAEMKKRMAVRGEKLGYAIEPLPEFSEDEMEEMEKWKLADKTEENKTVTVEGCQQSGECGEGQ